MQAVNDVISELAPLSAKAVAALDVAPVPPCATERGVVKPDKDVISELAPDEAVPGK